MGNIVVTVREDHQWQGENADVNQRVYTYSGIEQVLRRTDVITNEQFDSGIELITIVDDESRQTAGSFVKDSIKYMRFTNTGLNTIELAFQKNNIDQGVLFTLEAGQNIIFGSDQFASSDMGHIVDSTYVDFTYFSEKGSFDSIKARSLQNTSKLEYIIASS